MKNMYQGARGRWTPMQEGVQEQLGFEIKNYIIILGTHRHFYQEPTVYKKSNNTQTQKKLNYPNKCENEKSPYKKWTQIA